MKSLLNTLKLPTPGEIWKHNTYIGEVNEFEIHYIDKETDRVHYQRLDMTETISWPLELFLTELTYLRISK